MNDDPELRNALTARSTAETAMVAAREAYTEAKATHRGACQRVEEILAEIVGDRPLLAAIHARSNGAAAVVEPPPAVTSDVAARDAAAYADVERRVGELKGKAAKTAAPATADDAAERWTNAEIDRELAHALRGSSERWPNDVMNGSTDEEIRANIGSFWPTSRVFVPPDQSGGKFGYTIAGGPDYPTLWMGVFKGPGHSATLMTGELVARARRLLCIPLPRPAETTPSGGPIPATSKPKRERPAVDDRHARAPSNGWTRPSLVARAGELLGEDGDPKSLILCNTCNALRTTACHPCPACRGPEYRFYASELRNLGAERHVPPAPVRIPRARRKEVPGVDEDRG
jgi:hypothetical protein